jgi:phosphoribosylformimino-5-aminoimidazole carboxamide ribotide isomerase
VLLIPAIDLRNGRCVRLFKGDFAAETRYEYEPHELLQRYRGIGASWLHVVDLDGAREGTLANRSIVVSLASQTAVRIQVGGGVRSAAVIDDLLRNRVARVVIGSLAVERPDEVIGWLNQFGAARICLAFDIRNDAQGVGGGWTPRLA